MRRPISFLGPLLLVLLVAACSSKTGTPAPPPPNVVAQGFLVGYNDSDNLTLDAVVETRGATGDMVRKTLSEADYTNSTFSLELGSMLANDALKPIKEAADIISSQAGGSNPSAQCDRNIEISDESALGNTAKIRVSRKITGGEDYLGEAVLVERDPQRAISWLYVNEPVSVRGSESCANGSDSAAFSFDLSLETGWNLLAFTTTVDGAKTRVAVARVGSVQDNHWLVLFTESVVGETGADAGSTAQNPKGTMGGFPSAELAGAVLVPDVADVLGRSSHLVDIAKGSPVGKDGSFNLNLVDVPKELLLPLSFNQTKPTTPGKLGLGRISTQAAQCSGTITVTGQPHYQEATLAVFLENKRMGSAQAVGDDTSIDWWYLDSPTTLDGTISCKTENGVEIAVAKKLSLVAGWNIIVQTLSASVGADQTVTYTSEWTRTTSLPQGTGWSYEAFRETEVPVDEPQGGADNGSTRDRLAGRLGQWPDLAGSLSVTFDPVADNPDAPSDLGSYVVASYQKLTGTDSNFVMDLPNLFETAAPDDLTGYGSVLDIKRAWVETRYPPNPSDPVDPGDPGDPGCGTDDPGCDPGDPPCDPGSPNDPCDPGDPPCMPGDPACDPDFPPCDPGNPDEPCRVFNLDQLDAVVTTAATSCEGDFVYDAPALYYARANLNLWRGQLAENNHIGNASVLVGDSKIASDLFWIFVEADPEADLAYADPAGTISGQVACQGDLYVVNMNLVQGWNIVRSTSVTLDNGNTAVEWATVPSAPPGTEWLARVNAR